MKKCRYCMTIFCYLLLAAISFKTLLVDAVKEDKGGKGKAVVDHHRASGSSKPRQSMSKVMKKSDKKLYPAKEAGLMNTKIRHLRAGDYNINIELKLVAVDTVQTFENEKPGLTSALEQTWFLVGSDGRNYISIRAKSFALFRGFDPAKKDSFLNRSFTFKAFRAFGNENAEIFGDYGFELRPTRDSSIKYISVAFENPALKEVSTTTYFQHLLVNKMAVDEQSFNPISLLSLLSTKSNPIDVEARIESVEPMYSFKNEYNDEKYVVNIVLVDEDGTKARVTARNFWAMFFDEIFAKDNVKLPIIVKLQKVKIDRSGPALSRKLLFASTTKISLVLGNVPKRLTDLAGKRGVWRMEIRLSIAREQIVHNTTKQLDITMSTDGVDKCQLVFPGEIRFEKIGQEFTLERAEVSWSKYGVLILIVDSETDIVNHDDQTIGPYDVAGLDYPTDQPNVNRSPIKKMRIDDKMIDINLKIVAADTVHVSNGHRTWTLVGSDGLHFINISAEADWSFQKLNSALGNDFINKIFAFRIFWAAYAPNGIIQGDVHQELRLTPFSSIEITDNSVTKSLRRMNAQLYFNRHFLDKKAIYEQSFKPILVENLAMFPPNYNGSIDIKAKILSVMPIKQLDADANGVKHRVLNVGFIENGISVQLSAKDFLADFLDQILSDKWWHDRHNSPFIVKLQRVLFNAGSRNLEFIDSSRITVSSQGIPVTLENLTGKEGICEMFIRLSVAREQMAYLDSQMITMGTDGTHKCQLIFPIAITFNMSPEFILNKAQVQWTDSGVLKLIVESGTKIIPHKRIGPYDFDDLDYPPTNQQQATSVSAND